MASNEGIGSPFLKQPPTCSLKLRIYESLFLLNQGVDQIVALLHGMIADNESVQCAVVEIEEVRCDMNADFTEKLADSERFDEGRFWEQHRESEKKWRDPDDVYIEVQQREEERKKEGLRPRLGVLLRSAVNEENERWKAPKERKNKCQKPAWGSKNAAPEKSHD